MICFFSPLDGEYNIFTFPELPRHADNDHVLRVSNLFKLQANLCNRNILTPSFLLNHLHDNYAFLSPQSPQQANPADTDTAYIGSLKDQHYFPDGQLLEIQFASDQYDLELPPYGTLPYFTNTI